MLRNWTRSQLVGLIGWLAITFIAAAVGSVASAEAPAFYAQLSKPDWAPPASVFGPVWTVLYLLMGIAAWLVWRERSARGVDGALSLFLIQLAANALWSWLFFGWRQGAFALVDILLLLLLIAVTMASFWRINRLAAALLLPYFAWVAFASALTGVVWQRNPGLL
jgi:benzodiazapine receptor